MINKLKPISRYYIKNNKKNTTNITGKIIKKLINKRKNKGKDKEKYKGKYKRKYKKYIKKQKPVLDDIKLNNIKTTNNDEHINNTNHNTNHNINHNTNQSYYHKEAIPKRIRELVWTTHNKETFTHKCFVSWCDNKINVFNFQVGHDIPESKGGTLDIDNLKPICGNCNLSMGNKYTITEWCKLIKTNE